MHWCHPQLSITIMQEKLTTWDSMRFWFIDYRFLCGILPFWPHLAVFQSCWMRPVPSHGIQETNQKKKEETGQMELLAEEGTSCSSCSEFCWHPTPLTNIDRLPTQTHQFWSLSAFRRPMGETGRCAVSSLGGSRTKLVTVTWGFMMTSCVPKTMAW